jgi:hypothetical protein
MRAADSDRQFVADRLREALDEGRLTLGEYDDRLKDAYAARTYGELDTVLHDLPAVTPPAQQQVAATTTTAPAGPARSGMPGWLLASWGSWLSTSLICFVVWLLTSPGGYPWPLWVAGPMGAILLARTVMAYASGDPHGWEAAQRGRAREVRNERRRDRRGY